MRPPSQAASGATLRGLYSASDIGRWSRPSPVTRHHRAISASPATCLGSVPELRRPTNTGLLMRVAADIARSDQPPRLSSTISRNQSMRCMLTGQIKAIQVPCIENARARPARAEDQTYCFAWCKASRRSSSFAASKAIPLRLGFISSPEPSA